MAHFDDPVAIFVGDRCLFSQARHTAGPHMNPLCGRCGTCKKNRIRELADAGYTVVFVGDGLSDQCAAPTAHRIFAKGILADHLDELTVPYETFETLTDVAAALFCPATQGR